MFWWKDGKPVSWEWQSQVQFVQKFNLAMQFEVKWKVFQLKTLQFQRLWSLRLQTCPRYHFQKQIRHRWYNQQDLNFGENRLKQRLDSVPKLQPYKCLSRINHCRIGAIELHLSIFFRFLKYKSGRGKSGWPCNILEIEPPFNSTSVWFHKHFGPDFVCFFFPVVFFCSLNPTHRFTPWGAVQKLPHQSESEKTRWVGDPDVCCVFFKCFLSNVYPPVN